MSIASQLQATSYTPDPVLTDLRHIDGGLITTDWYDTMIQRGLGWLVTVGDLTTPIRGGGAGTVMLPQQPEMIVDIPAGTTCIPLRITIDGEIVLGAADDDNCESLITVDRTAINDAFSGTETIVNAINMRTDKVAGSPLTIATAVTANITAAPTRSFDLARHHVGFDIVLAGTPTETLWTSFQLHYEPEHPTFIVGPATLLAYWGTNIAAGFFAYLQADLLAVPSAELVNLA